MTQHGYSTRAATGLASIHIFFTLMYFTCFYFLLLLVTFQICEEGSDSLKQVTTFSNRSEKSLVYMQKHCHEETVPFVEAFGNPVEDIAKPVV